jgi:AhpD family alkylhydroperoxidase
VKQAMMEPGVLDRLTKELVYIAVSTANNCSDCVHSHTVAARSKGLSDEQYAEFLAVVGMAAGTNSSQIRCKSLWTESSLSAEEGHGPRESVAGVL